MIFHSINIFRLCKARIVTIYGRKMIDVAQILRGHAIYEVAARSYIVDEDALGLGDGSWEEVALLLIS